MAIQKWIIVSLAWLLFVAALPVSGSADDFTPTEFNPAKYVEYERQLNAILLTRRDEEKQFISDVVKQVREGKIPAKLVNTSFDWVRKKRPDTKYPFIYFEKVLRLQAERLELADEVPEFDFSIYRKPIGQLENGQRTTAGQKTETRSSSFFTPGSRRK